MIVDDWLARPMVDLVSPGDRHWSILRRLLLLTAGGPLVSDAHLAALALEHGGTLFTRDSDFSRFEDLQVVNPLLAVS